MFIYLFWLRDGRSGEDRETKGMMRRSWSRDPQVVDRRATAITFFFFFFASSKKGISLPEFQRDSALAGVNQRSRRRDASHALVEVRVERAELNSRREREQESNCERALAAAAASSIAIHLVVSSLSLLFTSQYLSNRDMNTPTTG